MNNTDQEKQVQTEQPTPLSNNQTEQIMEVKLFEEYLKFKQFKVMYSHLADKYINH